MAQHDYTIANQGFPAFRSDLNDALAAVVSNNSGATEPTTMFAHQIWVDTAADPSILKIRNADNDAWVTIGTINQTADTFTLTSAVSATTLNTSGAVVFNDSGADVDFRVESDTNANAFFVEGSSGNVGIGTSSPSAGAKLHVSSSGSVQALFESTGSSAGFQAFTSAGASPVGAMDFTSSAMIFYTGLGSSSASERMRIDSSGNLLVGATAALGNGGGIYVASGGANIQTLTTNSTTSNAYYIGRFYSGGVEKGYIYYDGTNVSYTNLSDYRLKENVAPMTGALAKVLELNPVTYTWKVSGSSGEGFIAHELQAVCPEAVTGEKDATEIQQVEVSPAVPATYDDEGNELTPAVEAVYEEREVPKYQGVDTSFLVATLTAAIQELSAKNDALEARIAALENA